MATITEALAEVYASNPQGEVVLDTLELRHSSFIDGSGNPAPIRVVADYIDLTARLEFDAPLDAGKNVTFLAVAFQFSLPSMEEGQAPQIDIVIDGASAEIIGHLESAVTQTEEIECTHRRFLASNSGAGPQDGEPLTLYIASAKATLTRVTATATLTDINNSPFPSKVYSPNVFPGLVR
ncbi:DUF1833 family protein [Paraburkholderia caribensis]|uniref:DUF1833 family protein n=1 Tax=Paraburkholderia caribensis TaxID=75105 RepID=UPI0007209EF7|nr:DUF1833 family protein [Paraburkholderia caribensis]ALP62400.1 hypothetical protein AN416_07165 [Paraburkholderia caribensis]AUT52374.1 DUF1833 domain-containing protein [Paraburkholderia caribensis]